MKKAVFLDRDGTLIKDKQHLCEVKKIELLDGVIEGLQKLQARNFLLFIITNQSGVGRGLFTESRVHEIHNALLKKLSDHYISINEVFYCPHHPDDGCICRKPSPHFVHYAQHQYNIDISQSFFMGDKGTDAETGKNAGTKTVYIRGSYDILETTSKIYSAEKHGRDIMQKQLVDFFAYDFLSGVEWIIEHDQR